MVRIVSALAALLVFTANLCASHCDIQQLDPHACCHHRKAPVKVDLGCSTVSEKVEVSFASLDLATAPRQQPVLEPSLVLGAPPEPRPPDLPAPQVFSLRV
jgi:methionine-rich copper-binding protein CopC